MCLPDFNARVGKDNFLRSTAASALPFHEHNIFYVEICNDSWNWDPLLYTGNKTVEKVWYLAKSILSVGKVMVSVFSASRRIFWAISW